VKLHASAASDNQGKYRGVRRAYTADGKIGAKVWECKHRHDTIALAIACAQEGTADG